MTPLVLGGITEYFLSNAFLKIFRNTKEVLLSGSRRHFKINFDIFKYPFPGNLSMHGIDIFSENGICDGLSICRRFSFETWSLILSIIR